MHGLRACDEVDATVGLPCCLRRGHLIANVLVRRSLRELRLAGVLSNDHLKPLRQLDGRLTAPCRMSVGPVSPVFQCNLSVRQAQPQQQSRGDPTTA